MEFIDHHSAEVRSFVDRTLESTADSPMAQAVALYYAVRDRIRYEVYGADLSRDGLKASQVLRTGSGMCIHKSIVYAAALRAIGVPSRLVLTDVRNHLSSPRLRELVGGDVFRFHCLTSVHNGQKWVRATPVFNKTLCRLYGIASEYHDIWGKAQRAPDATRLALLEAVGALDEHREPDAAHDAHQVGAHVGDQAPLLGGELLAGQDRVPGRDALQPGPKQAEVCAVAGADQHVGLGGAAQAGEVAGGDEDGRVGDVGSAG